MHRTGVCGVLLSSCWGWPQERHISKRKNRQQKQTSGRQPLLLPLTWFCAEVTVGPKELGVSAPPVCFLGRKMSCVAHAHTVLLKGIR